MFPQKSWAVCPSGTAAAVAETPGAQHSGGCSSYPKVGLFGSCLFGSGWCRAFLPMMVELWVRCLQDRWMPWEKAAHAAQG